ncbi:hypothetical protein KIH39_25920 [Telmatocola sphagniphila]|uniref:Uncharacterized protein n=1 Tax=Telmatocola sphagniphila TaxID=1123043 RepID=A0A8E6EYC5_9BACT|nr:hypothetical protein [Telmatocola sphagniphila]QVL32231.1 hypothetical protein KIH39_25920 [Telmatocola sphagniphila]
MQIYIVLHHEVMGTEEDFRFDEMVFFTASTLKKALSMIKKCGVSRYSYWEIQTQKIDDLEWPEHVGYYGLRGGKLTAPPYEKCVAAFKKERPWDLEN